MTKDIIQNIDLPLISRKGLIRLLTALTPRDLDNKSTMFDAGYEKAKKEIAVVLEDELNVHFSSNPASRLLKQLRTSQ